MFRLLAPSRASPAGRILIRSELDRRSEMRPKIDGILESSLYVSDLGRSVRFYQETFGFSVIREFGERGCALQAGTRQVLLLFTKRSEERRVGKECQSTCRS